MIKTLTLLFILFGFHSVSSQIKSADSLRTILSQTEDPEMRFDLLSKISESVIFHGGNVDSASCLEMLHLANELENDSLLAVTYNFIGFYFYNKGDNTSALEFYMRAIPLAEKVNDKRRISSLYFDISLVYFSLFNNEEAYKNIIKGKENLPDKSSTLYYHMLAQYQRNIAQYFILTNQADSALYYAQALVETSRRTGSVLLEYAAMYLNGSAYAMTGDTSKADDFFQKAIALSDQIEMEEEKLKFYESYLDFLIGNNKIEEAHIQAHQLMDLGIVSSNKNLKMMGAEYLSKVFEKLNKTDSAYYYARMEIELSDDIFNYKNLDKVQALVFNEQLRILEEESKKAEEEKKRNERIQYFLIAIGIIILILVYLLFGHSFISNTKLIEFFGVMALLIVFEFLNLILHPFLENITGHTPLLMLLGLVIIAAFLVPFHHRAEKWTMAYMLRKNKEYKNSLEKNNV